MVEMENKPLHCYWDYVHDLERNCPSPRCDVAAHGNNLWWVRGLQQNATVARHKVLYVS